MVRIAALLAALLSLQACHTAAVPPDSDGGLICRPNCAERVCGTDGCGGTCGSCAAGMACELGQCLCRPNTSTTCCDGDVCLADACGAAGGVLVDCAHGCAGGRCASCTPSCTGKACGPDGCGGVCGSCTRDQFCAADGLCLSAAALCSTAKVWQQPAPVPIAPGAPKASDVSMRTLGRPDEALAQARAFHATRLEWIYKNDIDFIAGAKSAGLFVGGTVSCSTGTHGRMLDLNGHPITAPWMTWTPIEAWGCANRPEFKADLFAAVELWISRGAEGMQMDGPAMNVRALDWTPAAGAAYGNPNNVNAGCFCKECQWRFHRHLWESGQTAVTRASVAGSFTNELAQVFLADSAFTVFYVSRSPSGGFGIGGNARNGAGSVSARLYLMRTAFYYNTLSDMLSWTLPGGAPDAAGISAFTHDGRADGGSARNAGTIRAFFNGSEVGARTAPGVAVLGAFGSGGHLSVPLQPSAGPPSAGDLAELIVFDRELSASERAGVEAYLGARYGIAVAPTAARPPDQLVDAEQHLRVWLRADSINAVEGAPVTVWPARVGPDWAVPTGATLPSGQSAGAPTFLPHWRGDGTAAAVHFDGINDLLGPSWFSYRRHVIDAGSDPARVAPALRGEFRAFQGQSARKLNLDVMAHANAFAGRKVPFSGNLDDWSQPYYSVFDLGVSELPFSSDLGPGKYRSAMAVPRALGRRQLLTLPLPRKEHLQSLCKEHCARTGSDCATAGISDWDTCPELVPVVRQGIATSYAAGGLTQVPWDTYTTSGPRYYGTAAQYADLYQFVRDQAAYLDGYEDVAVAGYDVIETRYGGLGGPPLELIGGSGKVAAFVRAKPQDPLAPIVVHLVEWDAAALKPVTLRLAHQRLFGDAPARVELLLPRGADRSGFSVADLGDGAMTITVPPLSPWGMLIVTPPASGLCR